MNENLKNENSVINKNSLENTNSNSEIYSFKKMINNFFSNVSENDVENGLTLSKIWEETIKKIYNYGPKLSGHTKIIDLKNGILLIETDHPGWNQILQNNKNFILKGLKMQIKDVEIKTLAFRVKGNNSRIGESYEEIQQKENERILQNLDEEEKKLESLGFKNEPLKEEIPQEVKNLFAGVLK